MWSTFKAPYAESTVHLVETHDEHDAKLTFSLLCTIDKDT